MMSPRESHHKLCVFDHVVSDLLTVWIISTIVRTESQDRIMDPKNVGLALKECTTFEGLNKSANPSWVIFNENCLKNQ